MPENSGFGPAGGALVGKEERGFGPWSVGWSEEGQSAKAGLSKGFPQGQASLGSRGEQTTGATRRSSQEGHRPALGRAMPWAWRKSGCRL